MILGRTPLAGRLDEALTSLPVIAILRGLTTGDALDIVSALFEAGIRVAEVPLNSPDAFTTIALLKRHFGERMLIGAGTVTRTSQVDELQRCGADISVSPTMDIAVIKAAIAAGIVPIPGYSTPTEAFAAIAAGALHLKFFPAQGRAGEIASLRAVLPPGISIIAVGGVEPANMAALRAAGCTAFGIGNDIFQPGLDRDAVGARAARIVAAAGAPEKPTAKIMCNPEAVIGESPIWIEGDDSVFWVDPVGQRLLRHAAGTDGFSAIPLSQPVFGIAATPDGSIVGTLGNGFGTIDTGSGLVAPGGTVDVGKGCRMNDLAIDALGGLWGGSMHRGLLAGKGAIFHAASVSGPCRMVADGLGVANGMAFGPDGRLYVIDTLSRMLLAYPADLARATLGEPVIVADFLDVPGKPDGMIALADGSFWVAMWGGGLVVRIAADGALIEQIAVPSPNVSSVCLGAGGSLWISTSRMRLNSAQLARYPGSGGLYRVDWHAADRIKPSN